MAEHRDNRYHQIRQAFEDHHQKVVSEFNSKHQETIKKVKKHGLSLAGATIIATSILAGSPSSSGAQVSKIESHKHLSKAEAQGQISNLLKGSTAGNLPKEQEAQLEETIYRTFGVKVKAELEGNRLNDVYGYTGQEQHLYRWAGDSLAKHNIQREGIAPLLGAFGYFDNAEQEKYYIAVQLHELPTWNRDWPHLKPWYRFRKMFVYNPDNGKGVVAVIGDVGPAMWTGKVFGGSPEVMKYLERVDGAQKGKVVVLFVDDPEDKVALGPATIEGSNLAYSR